MLSDMDIEERPDPHELARDAGRSLHGAKERLLAVLSHELRTPLSPVLMALQSMESDPDMPAKFREDLAIARRNVQVEISLIDDLLACVSNDGKDKGVALCIRPPLAAAQPAQGEHHPPNRVQRDGAGKRILLVEDHSDSARILARLLAGSGFQVRVASSAAAALQLAAAERFDIVLSDIGLPDSSGYELMRQLRGRFKMPGVALSGYGTEEDIRCSREAGFNEHLIKPVDVTQLISTIDALVGRCGEA